MTGKSSSHVYIYLLITRQRVREKVDGKVSETTKKFQRENRECFGVTGNVLEKKKIILAEMFRNASRIILGENVLDLREFFSDKMVAEIYLKKIS